MRLQTAGKHEGGHVFRAGECVICGMLYAEFTGLDSKTRGKQCPGPQAKMRERPQPIEE
jgi:hypothetical protein